MSELNNNEENWIYTKDKLPPLNQRILLYIITDTKTECSKYGTFNGTFYETQNSDYSKEEIVAWQIIEPPKKLKEILENSKLIQKADEYADEKIKADSEFIQNVFKSFNIEDTDSLIEWMKSYLRSSLSASFISGYNFNQLIEKKCI